MRIVPRDVSPRTQWTLEQSGVPHLLARLYAARGITSRDQLDDSLKNLLRPTELKDIGKAAQLLGAAIATQQRICVVADYDCDGATACAVAIRGLHLLGAQHVDYLVPNRVIDGYGLTPAIAQRVKDTGASFLITVDNGIASMEGVAHAKSLGLTVLITDHHLPAETTPAADAIVNPNQHGCAFASKALAGVGVMFYVLLATRAHMRAAHPPPAVWQRSQTHEAATSRLPASETAAPPHAATEPKLDVLLPLVALGTVADLVRLDANNRRLVAQGLKRIRRGELPTGMAALFYAAKRSPSGATAFDFGFALGPRLNAAGRLADMRLGIECLLTEDPARATQLANALDQINRQRRDIESQMRDQAIVRLTDTVVNVAQGTPHAICVEDASFHEGIVGLVATRLKDLHHRPAFVFAPAQASSGPRLLKGSGRSIAGFHLRDALDLISKRAPHLLVRFGGHAMAAGCTIYAEAFAAFGSALNQVAREWLSEAELERTLLTDGSLAAELCRVDVVDTLNLEVWGQGFEPPVFCDTVEILSQRIVGEKHLALKVRHQGSILDAIWFNHIDPLDRQMHLAYRLHADEWQGVRSVKWMIEAATHIV